MMRVTYELTVANGVSMETEKVVSYFRDDIELCNFIAECEYAKERIEIKKIVERVSVVSIWNDDEINHAEKIELIGMLMLPYHQFKGKKINEIEKSLEEMGVI